MDFRRNTSIYDNIQNIKILDCYFNPQKLEFNKTII